MLQAGVILLTMHFDGGNPQGQCATEAGASMGNDMPGPNSWPDRPSVREIIAGAGVVYRYDLSIVEFKMARRQADEGMSF